MVLQVARGRSVWVASSAGCVGSADCCWSPLRVGGRGRWSPPQGQKYRDCFIKWSSNELYNVYLYVNTIACIYNLYIYIYVYIHICVCRFKMWLGADPGTSGRNGLRNPTRAWAIICPVPVVKHDPRAKPAESIIGVSVTELCPTAVHPFKNDRLYLLIARRKDKYILYIYMCIYHWDGILNSSMFWNTFFPLLIWLVLTIVYFYYKSLRC